MSWQSYIDQITTKVTAHGTMEHCVEKAGIVSLADGSIWANTPDFGLYGYSIDVPTEDGASTEPCEINEIDLIRYVANNNGTSNSKAGIRIANERYYAVSHDDKEGTVYLKKNGGGGCLAKCNQCVVFASWNGAVQTAGFHPQPQNPGLCNELVEKVAQYLKSTAY